MSSIYNQKITALLSCTGGIILVAIDLRGMREYIKINPLARDFDSIYELLVESDIFSSETTERCDVEFTMAKRNLQMILSAKTPGDEEFCSSESVRIATVLDNPKQFITFLPDVMQFASAAIAVGQVLDPVENLVTMLSVNGATPVTAVAAMVVYAVIACLFVLQ